jgi:UDP-glucose 4-epimerase
MAKSILVSGGAGFVGRHLVVALLRLEPCADVWIIDDMSTGKPPEDWELYKAVERKRLDWGAEYVLPEDGGGTFTLIRSNFAAVVGAEIGRFPAVGLPPLPKFDEVYHLASIVGGRKMIEGQPLLVGMDLAIDSLFFLWAAMTGKASRILYASSSAAYPISDQTQDRFSYLSEEAIDFVRGVLAPDLTYGWSKLTGEYLAQIAVEKYGLSVGVIRPFSGYGEDQDLCYPVPAIALRVAAREAPIRVWGSGLQGRDFVHIDDCIQGAIMVCRQVHDGSAVNLGSGVLTSFRDLARLLVRLEGYEADVVGTDNRPVGVAQRVCTIAKAKRTLGWAPQVSLEEGMRKVLAQAHKRLAKGRRPEA